MVDFSEKYISDCVEKFKKTHLNNFDIYERNTERAKKKALDAISYGMFGTDLIERKVGEYEGQVLAIQNGWVDYDGFKFTINEKGVAALIEDGRSVPHMLEATDTWHNSTFQYCVKDSEIDGEPSLILFKKAHSHSVGMRPELNFEQVKQLHSFLGEWLQKNSE